MNQNILNVGTADVVHLHLDEHFNVNAHCQGFMCWRNSAVNTNHTTWTEQTHKLNCITQCFREVSLSITGVLDPTQC